MLTKLLLILSYLTVAVIGMAATAMDRGKWLTKFKKQTKGGWKKASEAEAKAKGSRLPDGIVNGVAILTSYKLAETKKGNPYVAITGIVQEPDNCKGLRATIMHFIQESEQKSIQDKLDQLSSDIQLLGCETAGCTEDQMIERLDARCKEKPAFLFNTWQPDGGDTMVFIQGLAEGEYEVSEEDLEQVEGEEEIPEGEEGEVQAGTAEVEVDFLGLGSKADEGDGDAIDALEGLAGEASLDPNDYPDSWTQLAEALVEFHSSSTPESTGGEGGEEAPWIPVVEDIYLYKSSAKAEPKEVQVSEVNEEAQTIKATRLEDGYEFQKIPFAKLEDV